MRTFTALLCLFPKEFLSNQLEQLRADVERGSPSHTLQVPTWFDPVGGHAPLMVTQTPDGLTTITQAP